MVLVSFVSFVAKKLVQISSSQATFDLPIARMLSAAGIHSLTLERDLLILVIAVQNIEQ